MPDQSTVFVNVLDVDPARQDELVQLLTEGLDQVIRHRPGFLSAEILASLDGARVINRAQWRSAADAAATQQDPDAAGFARRAAEIATPRPAVFRVRAEFGTRFSAPHDG